MNNLMAITPINGFKTVFQFINTGSSLSGQLSTIAPVVISYGDGATETINGTNQSYSHTYSAAGTYQVKLLSINKNALTKFWQFAGNVSFAIADIPASVANIFSANNTITGSLADFSSNISTIEIRDGNTINGNLNQLSSGVITLYVSGNNTITGDLVDLPASCNYLYITGTNTISGDLADLPTGFNTLYVSGNNTITGDLVDLPASLSALGVFGNNTITGNLVDLPANLVSCWVYGDNTIFGDLTDIPATLTIFEAIGDNTISDFSGTLGNTSMVNFVSVPISGGLSTLEVDNLLIALSAITFINSKLVILTGSNAARSAASDAAVTSLQAQGVTVTTF